MYIIVIYYLLILNLYYLIIFYFNFRLNKVMQISLINN